MFFSLTSDKLAAYNLGEEIGQGGFGCVFSGTRKIDNFPVSTVHEQLTVVSLEYNKAIYMRIAANECINLKKKTMLNSLVCSELTLME